MYINALTQNPYSGRNIQKLTEAAALMQIEDQEVAGFQQWLELGRCVQKGQRGTKIFMGCSKKFENSDGETDKKTVFKGRTVFFKSQTAPTGDESIEPVDDTKPETKTEPKPIKRPNPSEKLRTLADKLQTSIDNKFADRLTNTPKRLAQYHSARNEGERLQRTQTVLNALADHHDAETIPEILANFTTKSSVYELMGCEFEMIPNGYHAYQIGTNEPRHKTPEALALWALLTPETVEQKQAKELDQKVKGLQFSQIPGYFPTPKAVIDLMIEHADIYCNMEVLEPSAGSGAIADTVKAVCGKVETVEINHTLAEILKVKGHKVSNDDFLKTHFGYSFDRILMNPPFENQQDIDHVRHAYSFLGEMGRLVSVMSASIFNSTKKSVAFREWLDSLGAEVIDLPEGSFKESGTMINAVLVVIDRN